MARARNIKPGFFTNDQLAEIDPLGRILFIGLWTIADREGRMEDRPRRIKAELLPYDDSDVDSLLQQLEKHGFILRYSVGEDRYIQVLNFTKHQNPHVKESASTIPAPDEHGTGTVQEQNVPDENPADSLNPITDTGSLIPDTPTESAPARDSSVEQRFAEFWNAYPKKADKDRARKAFSRIRWSQVEFSTVMAALEQHKRSAQWTKDNGEFIPNPTTWLNNSRWELELPPPSSTPRPKSSDRITSVEQLFAQGHDHEPARDTEDPRDSATRMASSRTGQGSDSSMDAGTGRPGIRVIASRSG